MLQLLVAGKRGSSIFKIPPLNDGTRLSMILYWEWSSDNIYVINVYYTEE